MDICAICHEDLEGDLYTVPECSHIFHTNCVMQWWRAGHNTCPLCNNPGVNAGDGSRGYYGAAAAYHHRWENYKRLRHHARRKVAPLPLKKAVERLRSMEKRIKAQARKNKEWRAASASGKTNREVCAEHWRRRANLWKAKRKLMNAKLALAASDNIVPIIIAKKVEV